MKINDLMISSKARQYQFENASWIRLIEFLDQENSYMKNRLSEILDQINDRDNLNLAESFQTQFIIKDDLYEHLLHELKGQARKIKEISADGKDLITQEMKKTQKNFRNQIELIERDHNYLKKDYNTYLSSFSFA